MYTIDMSLKETKFPNKLTLENEVILLTGGSGFLGQHIIRVLQERAEGIKEIRTVDVVPYVQKLSYLLKFPVNSYLSDITEEEQLDKPFEGATVVIHTAGEVNVGHYVDRDKLRKINVLGTENVIKKCQKLNVPKLILTSSVEADRESEQFLKFLPKSQKRVPLNEKQFLMGYYAYSKALAENIILSTRNEPMRNGSLLKTIIIRPVLLYGELDPHFIPTALRLAKTLSGHFPQPKFRGELGPQASYAGNVAWAHVLAISKLNEELMGDEQGTDKIETLDCQAFNITDDSPFMFYEFLTHFLEIGGYSLVKTPAPLALVEGVYRMFGFFAQSFPDSWKKCLDKNPIFPSYRSFKRAHLRLKFSSQNARDNLHYKPIYEFQEALELCSKYYRDILV